MDKRNVFFLLLSGCGACLIFIAHFLSSGSGIGRFVLVATSVHNASISYKASVNLDVRLLQEDNKSRARNISHNTDPIQTINGVKVIGDNNVDVQRVFTLPGSKSKLSDNIIKPLDINNDTLEIKLNHREEMETQIGTDKTSNPGSEDIVHTIASLNQNHDKMTEPPIQIIHDRNSESGSNTTAKAIVKSFDANRDKTDNGDVEVKTKIVPSALPGDIPLAINGFPIDKQQTDIRSETDNDIVVQINDVNTFANSDVETTNKDIPDNAVESDAHNQTPVQNVITEINDNPTDNAVPTKLDSNSDGGTKSDPVVAIDVNGLDSENSVNIQRDTLHTDLVSENGNKEIPEQQEVLNVGVGAGSVFNKSRVEYDVQEHNEFKDKALSTKTVQYQQIVTQEQDAIDEVAKQINEGQHAIMKELELRKIENDRLLQKGSGQMLLQKGPGHMLLQKGPGQSETAVIAYGQNGGLKFTSVNESGESRSNTRNIVGAEKRPKGTRENQNITQRIEGDIEVVEKVEEKATVVVKEQYIKPFSIDPSCAQRSTGVEDILCMRRPRFLPQYRNPCWREFGYLRCLPYFYIIGVCKTGTTDLFERLSHHPQVIKNNGILGKETWYWTWKRYGHVNFYARNTNQMSFNEFIQHFEPGPIESVVKSRGNITDYHPVVTGHGDPMDFYDHTSWKLIPQNDPSLPVPNITTPSLVHHVNPDVKLILLVRDPVERLFSNYLHGQFGENSDQFHNDVTHTIDLLNACTAYRSMTSCLYDEYIMKAFRVPISGSFYSIHLNEWLKVFPRKQIFITRTEDFSNNVANTLLNIFRFLKLDPLPTRDLYRIANMPHYYNTRAKETAGYIYPQTRQLLQELFAPYNTELARILGDEKFNFNPR